MRRAPVVVVTGTPVLEVIARMAAERASAALAVDAAAGRIAGILTEQDVTRRVAGRGVGDDTPIDGVMTRPVHTVGTDDFLYRAIGFMRRRGLRHMPAVDGAGRPAGMLYLDDALAAANAPLVDEIDRLTHEDTLDGLREVKAAQVQVAADLLAEDVPAPEILSLVSDVNNDIHRRVVRLCLGVLAAEGYGEGPPVRFCVLVMGSGGRGESYLFPDQDNGFALDDYPDERHGEIDPFFIALAERTTAALAGLGFPPCRGGVMAINPLWRKTLGQWRHQVDIWIARHREVMLRLCDVFFDFRPVDGDLALGARLRDHVTARARASPAFLRELYEVQAEHRAGIGLFGRLLTERADREHRGELNLKYAGTLPLAEAVRLLALRHGVPATGTLARIDALAALGALKPDEQDYLRGAFALITGLQLRRQIRAFQAGEPVTNFVHPDELTERELDMLKDAFRAINRFRDRLRAELMGDVF